MKKRERLKRPRITDAEGVGCLPRSGQVLCTCLVAGASISGGAGDVTRGPATIPATECHVGHRRRGVLSGVPLDGAGARRTTECPSRTVARD
jgi:hypothetical protein